MTQAPQTETLGVALPGPSTAGQLLRAARLKAGVHLAVLSVTLKVPVKQLEALEADQVDPAKGAVFSRGLASAVCRHLGVDSAPILALLPTVSVQLAPMRSVGETSEPLMRRAMGKKSWPPVAWGAAAMLVLIAALLWLPSPSHWLWLDGLKQWASTGSSNDQALVSDRKPDVSSGSQVLDFPKSSQASESLATPAVTLTSADSALAAPAQLSIQQGSTSTTPPQDKTPVSGQGKSAEWVFTASADSWIELKHGINTVVWSGLLKSGESQKVQSPLPVSVVVGRAQAVTVTLRGQPFDLKPHTQVTVARFELKE